MSEPLNPGKILHIGLGFWASKALLTAVEMELFTLLAEGPLNLENLREKLDLHPRSAHDFLDALVALGFLERVDGTYRNTPETELFLDKSKDTYVGGILEMANNRLYGFWGNLPEALRTGQLQNEAKTGGPGLFETLYSDPVRLKEFLKAMSGLSRGANLAIAAKFPWKDYRTIADVGTAQGDTVVQITKAHPHLKGIGYDLPVVGPIFEQYVKDNGLSGRVRFAPGSFFTDPLPTAEVITMGHILHDWDLEQKKMLIGKAYEALPYNGALIVYETLIDDDRSKNAMGLLMSLNMLIETPGGFDYTGADGQRWMREAGFRETRVQHLAGPESMVVGIK